MLREKPDAKCNPQPTRGRGRCAITRKAATFYPARRAFMQAITRPIASDAPTLRRECSDPNRKMPRSRRPTADPRLVDVCEQALDHPHPLPPKLAQRRARAERKKFMRVFLRDAAHLEELLADAIASSGKRRPVLRVRLPGARHRRARGRCSMRRHGSRRASGLRSGQDPGDSDLEPEHPAARHHRLTAIGGGAF